MKPRIKGKYIYEFGMPSKSIFWSFNLNHWYFDPNFAIDDAIPFQ